MQNTGEGSKGSMFNLLDRSLCPRLPLADGGLGRGGGETMLINFPDRGQGQEESSGDDRDPSAGPSVHAFSQQLLSGRNSNLEGW